VADGALTPHADYIAQYRALSGADKLEERQELQNEFLAEAEEYIAAHPNGPEIVQAKLNRALAIGLYGECRDAEAERAFAAITATYPDSPLMPEVMYYHSRLLVFAFHGERHEHKRALALKLSERFPDSAKAPYALSLAGHSYLVDAGDAEAATPLLKKVVEQYPGTGAELDSRRDLIRIAVDAGDTASARRQVHAFLERFHEARDIVPPASWIWRLTVEIPELCMGICDWEHATACFEAVLEAWPENDEIEKTHLRFARALFRAALAQQTETNRDSFYQRADKVYCSVIDSHPHTYTRFAAQLGLIEMAFSREDFDAVRERIDEFDRELTDCVDTAWAVQAQMELATLVRRHSLLASRQQFRQEGVARLQEIADNHPGTPEASRALDALVSHYTFDEPDIDRARTLNQRLLKEDPSSNAKRCATNVRCMMSISTEGAITDGEYFLLQLRRPELRKNARELIRLYPKLSSSARRRFINSADSLEHSPSTEQIIAGIIQYAKENNNSSLLKDAMLLQADCYLIKWQPKEALAWCDRVLANHRALLSDNDLFRLGDCQAMSLFWVQRYADALTHFTELEAIAPEHANSADGGFRTKGFYAYMRALTCFLDGDYATGKSLFFDVIERYPGTSWAGRARSYIDGMSHLLEGLTSSATAR
jgi:TolA-binding protein